MTCTPEGVVYLIDLYDLQKMDPQGQVTTIVTSLPDKKMFQLIDPIHYQGGISLDQQKNIYVADYSGRQVKKISP